jgi:hypothetical protein
MSWNAPPPMLISSTMPSNVSSVAKLLRNENDPPPAAIVNVGEMSSVLPTPAGSGANASFGAVSGVVVDVTHGDSVPVAAVVQPVGSAGAVTPSKFSSQPVPGVPVGVAVGVFVGVPQAPPVVPISWNRLSGGAPVTQLGLTTQPVPPEHAKPPPGLRNAAPLPDCTVRSVHPHCPLGVKFMFACTDTQYVPAVRVHALGRLIPKDPVAAPDAMATLLNVHTGVTFGSVPDVGWKNTFTSVAGPGPLKY